MIEGAFAEVVRGLVGVIYHLAYRMTLREEDTLLIVREGLVRAYRRCVADPAILSLNEITLAALSAVAEIAEEQQRAREPLGFEELDATIRGDPTQSGVVDQLTDPQRNRLLWELKQGCLTAVVNCLPPGERVAFVMTEILGQSGEQAAATLRISASALRVRVSRARKKVASYLAPRCEHVDPRNPCHCPSRLGVALNRGFIGEVRGRKVSLRAPRPFEEEQPQHDPLALFHTLPSPEPPEELLDELLRDLASGIWD
jgi:RNA polymerase sigma-70 factor (ECF subfamily)